MNPRVVAVTAVTLIRQVRSAEGRTDVASLNKPCRLCYTFHCVSIPVNKDHKLLAQEINPSPPARAPPFAGAVVAGGGGGGDGGGDHAGHRGGMCSGESEEPKKKKETNSLSSVFYLLLLMRVSPTGGLLPAPPAAPARQRHVGVLDLPPRRGHIVAGGKGIRNVAVRAFDSNKDIKSRKFERLHSSICPWACVSALVCQFSRDGSRSTVDVFCIIQFLLKVCFFVNKRFRFFYRCFQFVILYVV